MPISGPENLAIGHGLELNLSEIRPDAWRGDQFYHGYGLGGGRMRANDASMVAVQTVARSPVSPAMPSGLAVRPVAGDALYPRFANLLAAVRAVTRRPITRCQATVRQATVRCVVAITTVAVIALSGFAQSPVPGTRAAAPKSAVPKSAALELTAPESAARTATSGTAGRNSDVNVAPAVAGAATSAEVPAVFAGGVPSGVSELKAMQSHLRKLSDRLLAATVGVRVGQAYGSGVIVESTGLVLTAAHVAQRATAECEVILLDGTRVPAKSLGLNRNLDAALIQIARQGTYPTVEMAPKESIKAGQWCVATGHPGGVEKGRKPVLRLGRILETSDSVLVSDCTLVGGDSGGPLFDASGRVIGIHSRIGGMLTANLHVPIDGFHRSWERLSASEEWGHLPGQAPFIGVRGAAEEPVARITEVFPETPAERAGIKPGDIVLKLGGEPVTNFASLTDLIGRANPGETLAIVVKRGEERLELRIVIGKR